MADNKRNDESTNGAVGSGTAETMTNPRRRRALLAVIATGGMVASNDFPSRWSRPVIDSVMLPAHAQISPVESTCTVTGEIIELQIAGATETATAPFTGTIGEIPPSSVAPTGTSGTARWYIGATDINGGTTVSGGANGCETISRGASSYTIPLTYLLIDEDCFIQPS
jgi:hypothetical protein